MKTINVSIFFDEDLVWDIREEFKELIADGKTAEEATEILLANYDELFKDKYVQDLFWMALAASQWKYGRLLDSVKNKAVEAIDSGRDLERWTHDPKLVEHRKKVLAKLKEMLFSPQPDPKKIRKPFISTSPFETGDVISYRTNSEKYVLLRVIGTHEIKGGKSIVVEFLDWCGETIPAQNIVSKLKIKVKKYEQSDYTNSRFWMGERSKKDFPAERVRLEIKNSTPFQKELLPSRVLYWTEMDKFLENELKLK